MEFPFKLPDKMTDGYEAEAVGKVSEDLICIICTKLMRDAVEMKCGHGMCKGCLVRLRRSYKQRREAAKCPYCRATVTSKHIRANKMIDRLILSLNVKCENEAAGCKWQAELSNLQDHLQKSCDFEKVPCPLLGCTEQVYRATRQEHIDGCQYQTIECKHCQFLHTKKNSQDHLKECPMQPFLCPSDCQTMVDQKTLSEHLSSCQNHLVECPYHDVGCDEKITRKEFDEHCKVFVSKHLMLLHEDSKKSKDVISYLEAKLAVNEYKLVKGQIELKDASMCIMEIKTKLQFLTSSIQSKFMSYLLNTYMNSSAFHIWQVNCLGQSEYGSVGIDVDTGFLFIELTVNITSLPQVLNQLEPGTIMPFSYEISNGLHQYTSNKTYDELQSEGFILENVWYILLEGVSNKYDTVTSTCNLPFHTETPLATNISNRSQSIEY